MENEMKLKLQNALKAVAHRIELKTISYEQNLSSLVLDIEHIINPKVSDGRKNGES
jgi:hypothetical protein